MWVDEDGNQMQVLSLALSPGEAEQFYLSIAADSGRYDWNLVLPLLVDGKRQFIDIWDDEKRPFTTYGTQGLEAYVWQDDDWHLRNDI